MLMVIQFVSKEVNCFLLLLKSCKNGVIDFLRQGDDLGALYFVKGGGGIFWQWLIYCPLGC